MNKEKNYNEPERKNDHEKNELFKEDKTYDENELCKAGKLYKEGEVCEEYKEDEEDEETFAVIDALIELIKRQPVPPLKHWVRIRTRFWRRSLRADRVKMLVNPSGLTPLLPCLPTIPTPTKFFDPKRREFREFFGAEEAARLTPCNDDKPKNAEIMPLRACLDLHPMLKYPNIIKYRAMMRSAEKLQALLKDDCVNVKIIPEFNIGSISVELPELSVDLTHEFADIIVGADNFEIYTLINGNIRLDITFQSVLKSYFGDEKS